MTMSNWTARMGSHTSLPHITFSEEDEDDEDDVEFIRPEPFSGKPADVTQRMKAEKAAAAGALDACCQLIK